jgi:hypothetical protein
MLWMNSSEASYITGEILIVDGGQSLTTNNYAPYEKEAVRLTINNFRNLQKLLGCWDIYLEDDLTPK